MDEGKRLYQIRRGIRGDHARDGAVLVLVCSEVNKWGPLVSGKRRKGFGTDSGRKVSGLWAIF
jgi:hypothetical protein